MWGETPVAFIIQKNEATIEPVLLKDWANERLAKTQRLSAIIRIDEFPRNALGKVVKRELQDHPSLPRFEEK